MFRRTFFSKITFATLATFCQMPFSNAKSVEMKKKLIRPALIRPGAKVALIAPASPPAEAKFEQAFRNLTDMGFQIIPGKNMRARYGYLAGTDAERIQDIHDAFANPEVEAIWCVRGGYGCTRLLPHLDYDLIRSNPKPLIGYSDITALHLAMYQKAGVMSFHGQVGGGDMTEFTKGHIERVLFKGDFPYAIPTFTSPYIKGPEYESFVICPGKASGPLTGGNLSLLAAMTGTAFAPKFKNHIVFIEEIGEAPYRVDRLFTQLLQGSDLKAAAGIVLGIFNDCEQKGDSPTLKLADTLRDRLSGLGIPVYYGAPFGHISDQCVFQYGTEVRIDTDDLTMDKL